MQERLTCGSLAETGSFFLNAGNAPSSYAGKALSSIARKAPSLMLKGSLFFFYAGKAPYSFLMQQGLMQEKLHILSSRGPSDLKRHLPRAALALANALFGIITRILFDR